MDFYEACSNKGMRQAYIAVIFFLLLAASLMQANAQTQTELHWSVCERSPQDVLNKLGLKIKKTERRNVSYSDHWNTELQDFNLHSQGVVLRVRSYEDKSYKSAVKVEFSEFPDLSDEWTSLEAFKCEEDLSLARKNYFCSLSEESSEFTSLQKKFLESLGFQIDWHLLKVHGPALNEVWDLKREKKEKLVLERLHLKDGTELLEVSTRTDIDTATEVFEKETQWLLEKGIEFCETHESKTRQVLESYKSN